MDFKHQNLADDQVDQLLIDVQPKITDSTSHIDLSFNRLTVKGLQKLADFTHRNKNVSCFLQMHTALELK